MKTERGTLLLGLEGLHWFRPWQRICADGSLGFAKMTLYVRTRESEGHDLGYFGGSGKQTKD